MIAGGFLENLILATHASPDGPPRNRFHSFCRYDDYRLLGCTFINAIAFIDSVDGGALTVSNTSYVSARGMHYFTRSNTALFVNSLTNGGQLEKMLIGSRTLEVVSSNGTYLECRGDHHDRYLFGWKTDTSGNNQIFRTDHDGLNEITTDTATLLGVDVGVTSFSVDSDNDRLFFLNTGTPKLNCVDFDLSSNYTTFPLTLFSGRGGTDYSDGRIFYGSINPAGVLNNWLWMYTLGTDEYTRFATEVSSSTSRQAGIFLDKHNDRIIVAAYNYVLITDMSIDIGKYYMRLGFRTDSTVNISWEPIELAVGNNLYQDGVMIANTTDTSYQATGLVLSSEYEYSIEYTTDGTNFLQNSLYRIFHFTEPEAKTSFTIPLLLNIR